MRIAGLRVLVTLMLAAAAAGCGLKGALTLPEKNANVVIRGGQTSGAEGAPAPQPAQPAEDPDKLPPPDLPHSNSGSPR